MNNNTYDFTNPYELARYVRESVKVTPVTLYIRGNINEDALCGYEYYGASGSYTVFTEASDAQALIEAERENITSYRIVQDRRNSAIPLIDMLPVNARIEPGAFIREGAIIENNAVIMMGAIINLGAVVGEETMIDMGAVLGARATIGKRCHIGAGAVIAGVLEPPSKTPVIIEDDVLVGANAVVLEGIRVGKGAVVAAGAVVTQDVAPYTVVAGSPAVVVKNVDDQTREKTEILDDLRK
ncbi:MAG: 2,3,4,5-tetrahydropyridine-2,6-dicarboxylate N-acetyltransferase [Anaerofustis stercorihominis]|nr:2,3,4,5-tetrahydropyridine-2,6-dicarboxylate N-acetyltransferase [Anaerofustis stercorihominis]